MDGGWVGRRILSARGGPSAPAAQGFSFIEVLIAMSVSIVVLLANIYLFNTAHKDLALARSITTATNLATSRIADFRAMTIQQIEAASTPVLPPPCPSSANPLHRRRGSDTPTIDGILFTRTWVVSVVDRDHNGTPNNECDDIPDMMTDVTVFNSSGVVKVSLEVTWTLSNKDHHVAIVTLITPKVS